MDVLEQFTKNIFLSEALMILGFESKNDFVALRKEFKTFPNKTSNFVDLSGVIKSTKEISYYDAKLSSLSKVCFEILGKKMDKREQIPDCSRRPLRENQITYAALDAVCLLKIYHKYFAGQSLTEMLRRNTEIPSKCSTTDSSRKSNKPVEPLENSDYVYPAIVEDLTVVFTTKNLLSRGDIVDVEMNLAKATSSKGF